MTQTDEQCDAIVSQAAEAEASSGPAQLMMRHMRYPNAYVWLLLLSSMDIMLTWVILLFGGSEANPIARWAMVTNHELLSLIIYKFVLIVFFVVICEIVGSLKDSTGRLLSRFSLVIACVPIVWAMYLLWRHNTG